MTRNPNYTFASPLLASTPEQRVFLIHFEAENISKIEIIQLFR